MFFYVKSNREVQRAVRRDAIVQKIINAIYLVEAMPEANRQHAVSAMADPNLHVSLSSQPQWERQFRDISFWKISRALRNNLDSFAVSIRLDQKQWLNLEATANSTQLLRQLLLISVEVLVFGTILIAGWSVNRFTRPLQNFKDAAKKLSVDLHSSPIDVNGPSVVRETAEAMNDMQNRIQKLIKDRTQMLAAISHDLRTPITRMKLRAQFLADEKLGEDYMHDLDEMESMIRETLSFARDDAAKENKKQLDLVSLLHSICMDAREMGHQVSFHSRQSRIAFRGRSMALKRAFTNLIYNAIRYAESVNVMIFSRHHSVIVRIDDNGPGIPEDELEQVFTAFYRGEQSRSRDTGGVGLGLAVTRDIIIAHHGKITLSNRRPHGLRAVVEFSLDQQ
ncbi:MAG: two-component sensor histidine kinase [Coxiellaceae bacterium]|nr:two-component sensor histidine kinase [Coxiellaceae bacterium]